MDVTLLIFQTVSRSEAADCALVQGRDFYFFSPNMGIQSVLEVPTPTIATIEPRTNEFMRWRGNSIRFRVEGIGTWSVIEMLNGKGFKIQEDSV